MTENKDISGVLCVDKHAGVTSHDIVNKIRRLYGTKKVGHSGTLDPLATGVLPVMIGRAAKAADMIGDGNKRYLAEMTLGMTSDTEDSSGNISISEEKLPTYEEVKEAISHFTGDIMQTPPMYSAVKIGGRKLVDMARRGMEIERPERQIHIFSTDIVSYDEEKGIYSLDVYCSKGTYIRTLCADIGKYLGCGALMSALRRTESCGFKIEQCHTTEQLEAMGEEERNALLLPAEELFAELPKITLPDFFAHLAHCGCEIYLKKIGVKAEAGQRFSLYDKYGFFAVGETAEYEEGLAVKPIKHFRLEETKD